MTAAAELNKPKELPFNPGKIVEIDGWPRWITKVGEFELTLDIVCVSEPEEKPEIGIASFVVMEQNQFFLEYVCGELAKAIAQHVTVDHIILMTAESKGSHIIRDVWKQLYKKVGTRLNERIITLRKGKEEKLYMRPVIKDEQNIPLPVINFSSITSKKLQTLRLYSLDTALLLNNPGAELVFVDDFIGEGGTIVAVHQIFQQLGLEPSRFVAVVGSDGDLYKDTLAGLVITLLPQPFPLRLPTFKRKSPFEPWLVNM